MYMHSIQFIIQNQLVSSTHKSSEPSWVTTPRPDRTELVPLISRCSSSSLDTFAALALAPGANSRLSISGEEGDLLALVFEEGTARDWPL